MAAGCSHGDLSHGPSQKEVLRIRKAFDPEIRFELGDVLDTAAFRHGAKGTKDEQTDPGADFRAGIAWLLKYEPTHIAWGNHDARLVELADSPNGIIAHAAATLWHDLQDTAAKLKARTVPYRLDKGWFEKGGRYWGHGYFYGENAVRDHAEYLGKPVVMAHLHAPQEVNGRTREWTDSFCCGMLADIDKLTYAHRRRATARWGQGFVIGEICDTDARLWLVKCPPGEKLRLPFAI